MTEERGDTFNFEDLAGYIIINILSRLVGMMLRTTIILIGLVALIAVFLSTVITYVFWITAPAAILVCLILGVTLLFS